MTGNVLKSPFSTHITKSLSCLYLTPFYIQYKKNLYFSLSKNLNAASELYTLWTVVSYNSLISILVYKIMFFIISAQASSSSPIGGKQ